MVYATSELLVCKSYQVVFLEGSGENSPASCIGEQRHAYILPCPALQLQIASTVSPWF